MLFNRIRIYAEVLEQGIDFANYIRKTGFGGFIDNIYTLKNKMPINNNDSVIARIRKCKDFDIMITAISSGMEYPLLLVEYSTAVPADDHKMQRSDVYFWASVFKVPVMKISPGDKGMDMDFGGGTAISDNHEKAMAIMHDCILHTIAWERAEGSRFLQTKPYALSCIPYSEEILGVIKKILDSFFESPNFDSHYDSLLMEYKRENIEIITQIGDAELRSCIKDSSRFKWQNGKLKIKINRFGHAMDPDRGVLFFTNMMLGADRCIAEIQVNRSPIFGKRGGYKSLFDGISANLNATLTNYVKDIILNHGNHFTDENALFIFNTALSLMQYNLFEADENRPHHYYISDENLLEFLLTHPAMSSKSIFFLTTQLELTDINRAPICTITWSSRPIRQYLACLLSDNYSPTPTSFFSGAVMSEDIITYASVDLLMHLGFILAAVNYPGAQGDRCILFGSGKTADRTYIDIIAVKEINSKVVVVLQENKDYLSKSKDDASKLNEFINNDIKMEKLKKLVKETTGFDHIDRVITVIGASNTRTITPLDVDCVVTFEYHSGQMDVHFHPNKIDDIWLTLNHVCNRNGDLSLTLNIPSVDVIMR